MRRWPLCVCLLFFGVLSLVLGGDALAHSPGSDVPAQLAAHRPVDLRQVPPPSPPPASATATAAPQNDGGDLQVEMTGNGPLSPGDTATFTLAVTNLGPGPSQQAALALDLPAGAVWTSLIGPSGICSLSGAPGSQAIACAFGDLAPDAAQTLSISGKVKETACPGIQAAVTASAANEPADAVANNAVEATIAVNCTTDIAVTAAAVASTVDAGDTAGIVLTVTNLGPWDATGVTLADTLPVGATWTTWTESTLSPDGSGACTLSGTPGGQSLSCDIGDLAAGAIWTVTVLGRTSPASCGELTDAANVAATNQAADLLADNTASASLVVVCPPQVSVTLNAGIDAISAKDPAAFSIVVANAGPGTAHGVSLSEPLPAGIEWEAIGPDAAACTVDDGVLTCDFGDLPADATRTLTLTGETSAANCGDLTFAVTISTTNEPVDATTDNTASASIAIACPDLAVEPQLAAESISAGDSANVTITLTNLGEGNSADAGLAVPLPPGLDWQVSGADAAACAIENGALSCGFGLLGPGETRTVTLSAVTDAAACGDLTSNVTATDSNEIIGEGGTAADLQILANNMATATVTVLCPDVALTVTPDAPSVAAGGTIGYTVAVANAGPGDASGVTLTAELPSLDGLAWSIDSATPASDACTIAGTTLTCDVGPLAATASASIHVTSPAPSSGCDAFETEGTATVANEREADQANNTGRASVVMECPAIQITITPTDAHGATISHAPAGTSVTYGYAVTNTGNVPLTNVTARDDNATPDNPGDDLALTGCFIPSFEPRATVTCSLAHVLPEAATGTELRNVATVGATSPRGETVTATADVSLAVNPRSSIGLRTECPTAVTAGQTVTVTVFVSNTGSVVVANLLVTDTVAGPLSYATGDSDADGWLDSSETWTYTGSIVVSGDETSLSRIVSANGIDLNGNMVDVSTVPCTTAVQPPS